VAAGRPVRRDWLLVARGHTNREIARELVITEGAVGVHVEYILAKLQLRSRTQVAAWAFQRGLLDGDR
jgi:DNA-binding NarL/FixJ family response regulator